MKIKLSTLLITVVQLVCALDIQAQIIRTIAGSTIGYSGNGGPAVLAKLNAPAWVAVDDMNNIYVTDPGNYSMGADYCICVRKINSVGIISTIAGGGSNVFGDGGPATAAVVYSFGIAVDHTGNVYVSDHALNSVRKIDPTGIIKTVAGNSTMTGGYGGDGGPATMATLNSPDGIVIDDYGNIYIADNGNARVRKVDTFGIIRTIAGNGISVVYNGDGIAATSAAISPFGVAVDKIGNVYIADRGNNRIRKVDTAGIIATVAGNGIEGFSGDGGPADSAELVNPVAVSIDEIGSLYISDFGNNRIRKVDTNNLISTIAGSTQGFSGDNGLATNAQLDAPSSVTVDASRNVYITDWGNNRVREISTAWLSTNTVQHQGSAIVICPNPNLGSFTIRLPQTNNPTTITITNFLGSTIETKTTENTQPQNLNFDIHTPPGTYVIKVSSGDNTWREKIQVW